MPAISEEAVLNALRAIQDPDLRRDIVSLGFVKDVRICDGNVAVKIELTTPACPVRDEMKAQAEAILRSLPQISSASVEMTAQVRGRAGAAEDLVPGVRHIIAVASGKGGVGKSTVAANLAIALAAAGAKVGLLDLDIYGPTIPLLLGITRKPLVTDTSEGPRIVPVQAYGVLTVSFGFFLEEDKAVVWRGPMLGKAVHQLFHDVTWGEQDYLIVDLPPGTGDVPMSLAQLVPISGVVIVMTPQQVAQDIGRKSITMFRTLEQASGKSIPIFGIVENMSGGVFGVGGAEEAAAKLEVPFLGRVDLDAAIARSGDAGEPISAAAPQSAAGEAFRTIAETLAARISVVQFNREQSL
ncbi:MAG TPA: Mrp/NBP35 family ATP-binding protein [Chthonomonadales bacterium]|nr:Mrp/NBP35 family ATP-binding protein [Chthonomonadales bacterium]